MQTKLFGRFCGLSHENAWAQKLAITRNQSRHRDILADCLHRLPPQNIPSHWIGYLASKHSLQTMVNNVEAALEFFITDDKRRQTPKNIASRTAQLDDQALPECFADYCTRQC